MPLLISDSLWPSVSEGYARSHCALLQVVEDLERQFTLDNVTLLTSEVFQNDPYPQIQNLKVSSKH